MDAPKKWWWVVGVAVPLVVAVIAIVPNLLTDGDDAAADTFSVTGTQFNDKVTFNNVSLILEQAQQSGKELPDTIVETLSQAMKLVQSRRFDEAIPLLESVKESAPVPSVLTNLGATYLATGNQDKAGHYFKEALSSNPDERTARVNLTKIPASLARGYPGSC